MKSQRKSIKQHKQYSKAASKRLRKWIRLLKQDTRYFYDDLDRLKYVFNQNDAVTQYSYDKLGNQLSMIDPVGRQTQYIYDFLDRLTTMIDSAGSPTGYTYDANDNLLSMTDSLDNTTSYAYDNLNRQTSMTDALNKTSTMAYDAEDNLVETTDRDNRTRQFTFDDLNRLVQEDWLLNGSWTGTRFMYDYDAASNMTEAEDNFSHNTMQYGNMNNLTQVDNAGTPNAPHVVLDYTYDSAVRVKTAKDTVNGIEGATDTFTYSTLQNIMTNVTQTGTGVTTKIRNYTYDFFGRMTGFTDYKNTNANQDAVSGAGYSYDNLGRLSSLSTFYRNASGAVSGPSTTFKYDNVDRLTLITEFSSVINNQTFQYDTIGRLTSSQNSQPDRPDDNYGYDDNGNRISDNTHGSNLVYGDGNRLLSDGTYTYIYDDEGNLVKRTTTASGSYREMAFDFRNRLIMVTERDAADQALKVTTYTYDCFDRRISKQVDNTPGDGLEAPVQWFAYDGANVRLEFIDPDGLSGLLPAVLTTRYFNGLGVDNIIAQENYAGSEYSVGAYWHVKNYLGSTTDLVSTNGTDVSNAQIGQYNHIVYDAYGNVASQSNASAGSRYGYTGREFDSETGLQYYRARYYDSTLGRFVSEDPIANANLYSYVGGDPANYVDPSGMKKGGLMPISGAKYGAYDKRPTPSAKKNMGPLSGGIKQDDFLPTGGGGSCGGGLPQAGRNNGPEVGDLADYDLNGPPPMLEGTVWIGGGAMFRGAAIIPQLGGRLTTGIGIGALISQMRIDNPSKYFNLGAKSTSRNSLKWKGFSYLYEIDQLDNPTWQMQIWKFGITSQDDPTSRPEGQVSFLNRTPMALMGQYTWDFAAPPFIDRISARVAESQRIMEYRYFRGYPLLGNSTLY